MFILGLAALLPAVILCIYVFKKDRVEKEPIGLLIALLVAGVLICFPVVLVGGTMSDFVSGFFSIFASVDNGHATLDSFTYRIYAIIDNFICVSLVEEGFKWLALILITSKNKNFNSLFDGIIYAVFVSLGFAGFENILYVFDGGLSTALTRAFTAVPGHMFNAVIMGYYYSFWHILDKANDLEKRFENLGIISVKKPFSGKKYMVLSLIVPVLVHGFYDYCCTVASTLLVIIFYGSLIFLYIYCFRKIKSMSKIDTPDKKIIVGLLVRKYPQARSEILDYLFEKESRVKI